MFTEKKFAVYYRDIPLALEHRLKNDSCIKYAKDGIKFFVDGHRCPRLSVIIEPSGNHDQDKWRVESFETLLTELEANNQIVGFSG